MWQEGEGSGGGEREEGVERLQIVWIISRCQRSIGCAFVSL